MDIIKKIFSLFSLHATREEKMVSNFFKNLTENSSIEYTNKKILTLLQSSAIVLTLWAEYRYRGYRYLTKKKRKLLYENAILIQSDFESFSSSYNLSPNVLIEKLTKQQIIIPTDSNKLEKLIYLAKITKYLSPDSGRYRYRESSTFGELLKDPTREVLVGDCNQIVTLYIYLYSLKYPVNDLKIKLLPNHVCLHFQDIDIEATNGTFKLYKESSQVVLPIQEIVSVNLLDTTDKYFRTKKVPAGALLESARLAFIISSNRKIVESNLSILYNNAVLESIKNNYYDQALSYAQQSKKVDLIEYTINQAVTYYMNKNNFSYALKFSNKSKNYTHLTKLVRRNQGIYLYNQHKYHEAINVFKKIGNSKMIKQSYIGLFVQEQKKLGKLSTKQDYKNNSSTIRRLNSLAKASKDSSLINYTNKLLKNIK